MNNLLNDDSWMNDPESREAYEAGLIELDKGLKPITDALDESEKLTTKDFAITIN